MSPDLLVCGDLLSWLQPAASKRQESAKASEARQIFMTTPFPMCPAIRGRAPTHGRGWFEHIVGQLGCQSNSQFTIVDAGRADLLFIPHRVLQPPDPLNLHHARLPLFHPDRLRARE